MWFANEQHKSNYEKLSERFHHVTETDGQYAAACYIAAYPRVFEVICPKDLKQLENGPFDMYYVGIGEPLEEGQKWNLGGLTGATWRLCDLGLNLWNGNDRFNLEDGLSVWGDEAYKVFLQAIELRRRRRMLNIR